MGRQSINLRISYSFIGQDYRSIRVSFKAAAPVDQGKIPGLRAGGKAGVQRQRFSVHRHWLAGLDRYKGRAAPENHRIGSGQ